MNNKVVSREEWLQARVAHLQKEKAFDKERDRLTQERRDLPWVKVDKTYVFKSSIGGDDEIQKESLSDLFQGRSQLIVYHFMFGADWEAGCSSCSLLADHMDGIQTHLAHRDISLVVVSTADPQKLEAYKKRMGWNFKWVSAGEMDFSQDYFVTFTQEQVDTKTATYNYKENTSFGSTEAPGASVFTKKDDGSVYHTYSTYGRGLDKLIGAYHYMDMVPKGRDEESLSWPMAWVRRHDEYDNDDEDK